MESVTCFLLDTQEVTGSSSVEPTILPQYKIFKIAQIRAKRLIPRRICKFSLIPSRYISRRQPSILTRNRSPTHENIDYLRRLKLHSPLSISRIDVVYQSKPLDETQSAAYT